MKNIFIKTTIKLIFTVFAFSLLVITCQNDNIDSKKTERANKTELNQKIEEAETKMSGVEVSEYSIDVYIESYWVTHAVQTALENILSDAKEVSGNPNATQSQVNQVLSILTMA